MRRFITVCLALVFSLGTPSAWAAQAGSICVGVKDPQQRPAKEAIILLGSSDPSLSLIAVNTDAKGGTWFRDLPVQNSYSVSVLVDGFKTVSETVTVEPDKVRILAVTLTPEKSLQASTIAHRKN